VVPAVVLCAIGAAYGVRTHQRNPDWRNDETLFSNAVEAAPASCKAHAGLANAWFVEDPGFLKGDRAMVEAEKAAAIIGGLPNERSFASVFGLLGDIYAARGESLLSKDAAGNPPPSALSTEWYRKALEMDLRGAAVDRAQDQLRRRAELARGTPPERIGLQGLPNLYQNLGRAYMRLGDPQRALQAFLFQRRLASSGP
jgi:hypothetical protein